MLTDQAVVSARDLLPEAFKKATNYETTGSIGHEDDDNSADESDEEDVAFPKEDVVDDLQYDLFNLLACNYHEVRVFDDAQSREEGLLDMTQRATQLVIKR